MKRYSITVFQSVVKGLYCLIKRRQGPCLHTVLMSGRTGRESRSSAKPVNESRSARIKSLPIWKNRRAIIAAGAAAVILAVTLGLMLPAPKGQAEGALRAALLPAQQRAAVLPISATLAGTSQSPLQSPPQMLEISAEFEPDTLSVDMPEESPVPTIAPEPQLLVPGCDDPRIAEVQMRLMELGYMGEDEPTNHYGYGTEYALQLFQRKHALQVDGLLGEKTMAALFSDGAQPYTVKLGDRGTDVKSIQEQLIALKYLKTGSTGYFGTDTEAAVKSFQQNNGLTVDGNVGSQTLEALYSDDAKPEKIISGNTKKDANTDNKDSNTDAKTDKKADSKTDNKSEKKDNKTDTSVPPPPPDAASADSLVEYAKNFLGTKYVRGGKNPKGFDCSGFVYYCLNQVGYKINYMTSAGWAKSDLPKVSSMSDLQRGDIICFKGHVGIYMGDGNMIDASSSFGGIRICKNIMNSSYWQKTFICGRRVF